MIYQERLQTTLLQLFART